MLPEWGYVNCLDKSNTLAQYEIIEGGKVKQTEILKSNQISLVSSLAGVFYDGALFKENCKVFMMEKSSKSVVQVSPTPDNQNYYVIQNMETFDSDARSLKHNEDESLMLANIGKSIVVQKISA